MRRSRALKIIIAVALITAIGPVLTAIYLAQQQGLAAEFDRVTSYARSVAARSDRAVEQMQAAIDTLIAANAEDPCSEAMLTQMRQLGISMEFLKVAGAVSGERMLCSTLGMHEQGLALGPPDSTTPLGARLRLSAPMPFSSGTPYISIEREGFIAMAHRSQAVDLVVDQDGVLFATFDPSTGEIRTASGTVNSQWVSAVDNATEAAFIDDDYIVGVVRSEQVALTGAIAAIPARYLAEQVWAFIGVLLPIGLVTAVVLTGSVLYFARMQVSLPTQIRQGLRRNEFYLVYQPVVNLHTGRWVGVEALVRWQRADGRVMQPDEFIPVAEHSGLIGLLTEKVIELASKDMMATLRDNPDFFLSLNLSARDLQSGTTVDRLMTMVRGNGISAGQLVVELTERMLVDASAARAVLSAMRRQGIQVAIDDFGTGYCSLSYLETMQFDCLKIDRLFVEAIDTEAATNRVVLHIIEMARTLNLKLIAEGVETEAQAQYLREQGVEYAQGWLYSRAITPSELAAQLSRRAV
ncbi:MAG: cyclic diguanylate phosphodiesterase [Gammaproteobacteria bacterium]|nr:cyclic diguanylate phosphodiesterase [Gammaproteobacteria bacterium]